MSAPTPLAVGDRVLGGRLEVLSVLGEGGMGRVYEVRHRITKHVRALKVLHPHYAENPDVVTRFLREASVAGTLETPRVVETFDAGRLEDGATYVLMERLRGESLGARLEREHRLPATEIARLVMEACEGLELAHAAGIVHRDLKPDNLFIALSADGTEHVKLLDFGISKFMSSEHVSLTTAGHLMGTPLYMAPEQAEGAERADVRSDIYALGAILYEALAARPPFEAVGLPKLLVMIEQGDLTPLDVVAPDLDPRLTAIVGRAMARDPDARFQDAASLREALAPFASGEPAPIPQTRIETADTLHASERPEAPSAEPPASDAYTQPSVTAPTAERPRWPVLAIGSAIALSLALGAYALWGGDAETPSTPATEHPSVDRVGSVGPEPVAPEPVTPTSEDRAPDVDESGADEAASDPGGPDEPRLPEGRRGTASGRRRTDASGRRAASDGLDSTDPYARP
ncbi:MAG: protein kinase [Sandaracinaceae bacterium]